MPPLKAGPPPGAPGPTASAQTIAPKSPQSDDDIPRHEARNLFWLAMHQIVLRIGWIFKTESVIMPAFLDSITAGSASTLRSLLPMLNRFGQSVPPLLFAGRLRSLRRKKWALVSFSFLMGMPFLALSTLWFITGVTAWLPSVFLVAYALFFCSVGLNNLSFGTLQGKLIRPTRRGRLMALSAFVGAIMAVGFAWWLLRSWAAPPSVAYGFIFAWTGGAFVVAALCALMTWEPHDADAPRSNGVRNALGCAWRIVRGDANFRRLALVAMLFSIALMLFPHYQALARDRLGLGFRHLMVWVIVQNIAAGLCSLLIGPLADGRGNRLALRVLILLNALTPVLAVLLSGSYAVGQAWYWVVFAPLGMAPITIKTLNNYTLEICPTSEHPRYLSTLSICLATPFLLSPLVGWLIDVAGFDVVFCAAAVVIILGGLLTFILDEPRHEILPVAPPTLEG